jgi:hypothetical protein
MVKDGNGVRSPLEASLETWILNLRNNGREEIGDLAVSLVSSFRII